VTFKSFLSFVTMCILIVTLMAQIAIESTTNNIVSCLIITLTTVITLAYLYCTDSYAKTPISAVALIILLFSGIFGALLFQTLFWNPVTKYLYDPINTFSKLSFYLLIAISSHYLYSSLFHTKQYKNKYNKEYIKEILIKIGLYNIPSVKSVWTLSILGLAAMILGKILPGTVGRLILNFHFLMWFPFFILFYIYKFGKDYAHKESQKLYISIYFVLIVIVGIAFNSRGLIVAGLVNLFLTSTIVLLSNNEKFNMSFYIKISFLLVIMLSLLKPLSSFSDAMLDARSERSNLSPTEMLENTFDIYWNSTSQELVEKGKYVKDRIYTDYDEDYIENGILTRFVLTKFHDNAYNYASKLSEQGKFEVRQQIKHKIIAVLPQPIIDILGIELNKLEIMKSTMDIMVHETTGRRLGGLKVSSAFVDLEIVFGYFSPIVFFFLALIFFKIIEFFGNNWKSYGFAIVFPLFALASEFLLFLLPIKGIIGVANLLLREFIENVLIFCILTYIISFAIRPYKIYTGNN